MTKEDRNQNKIRCQLGQFVAAQRNSPTQLPQQHKEETVQLQGR